MTELVTGPKAAKVETRRVRWDPKQVAKEESSPTPQQAHNQTPALPNEEAGDGIKSSLAEPSETIARSQPYQ